MDNHTISNAMGIRQASMEEAPYDVEEPDLRRLGFGLMCLSGLVVVAFAWWLA